MPESRKEPSRRVPSAVPYRLNPAAFPLVLPHYRFGDSALYFGAERLREERPGESDFARQCDGRTTFAEIVKRSAADARHAATARYLAWWPCAFPQAPPKPPARAETIVLAPHPDDAELAMAGWLLQQPAPETCLIVVCFSTLSHSIEGAAFPDAAAVSHVRNDETLTAARALGVPVIGLEYPEYGIRHGLTPMPLLAAREHHMAAVLKRRLYTLLQAHRPARIFGPAALGGHPDHRMLFDLLLEFCDEDFFPETRFDLYEEAPYAARFEAVDDFLARFEGAYLQVRSWSADIEAQLPRKTAVAEMFRSQFKPPIRDVVETIARRNAARDIDEGTPEGRPCEVFWRLEALGNLAELL